MEGHYDHRAKRCVGNIYLLLCPYVIFQKRYFSTKSKLCEILPKLPHPTLEVDIPVDPNVKPMFFRARPVSYSRRDKIEKELERLVKQGVYEPVASLKWAAPIVPVLKDDGSVRICGDYKQTVNKAAACDKYPVPKREDIFATIVGGGIFEIGPKSSLPAVSFIARF